MNMNNWSLGEQNPSSRPFGATSPLTLSKPIQLNFGLPTATSVASPVPQLPSVGNGDFSAVTNSNLFSDVAPANSPGLMQRFSSWLQDNGILGYTDEKGNRFDGLGGMALNTASGAFNAYMGMKQLGLFKDQLNFQKDSFERNYAAQRDTLNTQMADRQAARVASNPGAYQSVSDYMAKNRIA